MPQSSETRWSRRQAVKVLVGTAAAAALPSLALRGGPALAQADCSAVFSPMVSLAESAGSIVTSFISATGSAARGAGAEQVAAVTRDLRQAAQQMSTIRAGGMIKGIVMRGVQTQRAQAAAIESRLGREGAIGRLQWAIEQYQRGNHQAVAQDPDFAPIVNAGIESYRGFLAQLDTTTAALRQQQRAALQNFADAAGQARASGELQDEQIDRMLQVYRDNAEMSRVLQQLRAAPVRSALPPFMAPDCTPCGVPEAVAAAPDKPGNRLWGLLGVRNAHAVPIVVAVIVVVVAVAVTIAFLGALWALTKCVETVEPPSRHDECLENARRKKEAAFARAEQGRQDCLNTCTENFGIRVCTPDFVCLPARVAQETAAHTIYVTEVNLCFLLN